MLPKRRAFEALRCLEISNECSDNSLEKLKKVGASWLELGVPSDTRIYMDVFAPTVLYSSN